MRRINQWLVFTLAFWLVACATVPTHSSSLMFKNQLYFWKVPVNRGESAELWRTDKTQTNAQHLFTLPSPNGEYLNSPEIIAFAGRLYIFEMDGAAIPSAVWQTDGSAHGEKLVMRHPSSVFAGMDWGSTWSFPSGNKPILIHNDKLIFITYKPNDRFHLNLWAIDANQPDKAKLLGEFQNIAILPAAEDVDQRFLFFNDGNIHWKTDGTVVD